jgi:hypothetical protein
MVQLKLTRSDRGGGPEAGSVRSHGCGGVGSVVIGSGICRVVIGYTGFGPNADPSVLQPRSFLESFYLREPRPLVPAKDNLASPPPRSGGDGLRGCLVTGRAGPPDRRSDPLPAVGVPVSLSRPRTPDTAGNTWNGNSGNNIRRWYWHSHHSGPRPTGWRAAALAC